MPSLTHPPASQLLQSPCPLSLNSNLPSEISGVQVMTKPTYWLGGFSLANWY